MSKHLHKCVSCNCYTLKDICTCGNRTILPRPPKFSLQDKYADYRRISKREELRKINLY